jgi:hypothetical protein
MNSYALFYHDRQVSKAHSTELAALTEAFERGAVITSGADFIGDLRSKELASGYEIKPPVKSNGGENG